MVEADWRLQVPERLTLLQRLRLRLFGHVFYRYMKRPEWRGRLPVYIVRCKRHGLFLDYPHGFRGYFTCPKCFREEVERREVHGSLHAEGSSGRVRHA